MIRTRTLCLFLSLVLFLGCSDPGPLELTQHDKDAIRATSAKWMAAAESGDWETLLETYTDDAILWFNGGTISGKTELREYFSQLRPMQGMTLVIDEIYGRGDLAVVSGHSYRIVDDDTLMSGRYLDTRLRQPNGEWLFHRDMVTNFMAPPFDGPRPMAK